jgi:hypothetical protein
VIDLPAEESNLTRGIPSHSVYRLATPTTVDSMVDIEPQATSTLLACDSDHDELAVAQESHEDAHKSLAILIGFVDIELGASLLTRERAIDDEITSWGTKVAARMLDMTGTYPEKLQLIPKLLQANIANQITLR